MIMSSIPYRLDLCGGWLDCPFVNKYCCGTVINISLEPTYNFINRSGMATSTRNTAKDLWGSQLPFGDNELLAMRLFLAENGISGTIRAGSQDAIGIVYPGINMIDYARGSLWSTNIKNINYNSIIDFLEGHICLIQIKSRDVGLDVMQNNDICQEKVKHLSEVANLCKEALMGEDVIALSKYITEGFKAQVNMFPYMNNSLVEEYIERYKNKCLGYKLSGAGGGGYLVLVCEDRKQFPDESIPIKIRR